MGQGVKYNGFGDKTVAQIEPAACDDTTAAAGD